MGTRTRDAVKFQRQADIFANREGGNQVEELEYKPDVGAPEESPIAFAHPGKVLAIHPNLPAVRCINAAD